MWELQVVFAIVLNFVHTASTELLSSGTFCMVDPTKARDLPGNSYYCPAYNEDGSLNTFTECCSDGRPGPDYQKCCQTGEVRSEQKWGSIKETGIYVGIATACLLTIIFVFTYCRSDTYPCVGALQRRVKYGKDACLDAICFCDCFKTKRKTQRRLEATKLNQIEPLCERTGSQEQLVVPMVVLEDKQQFWW
ncbi:uncharacterized protein LOC119726079 [Patiria miniata]|uniref:Uncharacterized protein n=1 Tax=Patiria miniata TaxID=46514 RepID=A0A913ZPB0_PATMI|nr:uncharacterized protein LOC119726079 [Patiria miniata]